jgi:hypothetical protein
MAKAKKDVIRNEALVNTAFLVTRLPRSLYIRYGGMENPMLTFVTPTLLAGDRSLVNVVVHEIVHRCDRCEVLLSICQCPLHRPSPEMLE